MSEEVWKYLPHVPVKKTIGFKRKSEVTDKEVLNLTGGLFPLKLVDTAKVVSRHLARTLRATRKSIIGFEFPSSSATAKLGLSITG